MTLEQARAAHCPETADERRSRRIGAFSPHIRPHVRDLVDASPALADLADSFPGLLFALASGHGVEERRQAARRAVEQGLPLRAAASLLQLPWWTRRLPPQAFAAPLDRLPRCDAAFNERIVPLIPAAPAASAGWLAAVQHAYAACNGEYALWVAGWAGRRVRSAPRPDGQSFQSFLAAWAWHASEPEAPGHALLRRRWTPQMGLRRAIDEMSLWRRRLALELQVDAAPIPQWLADGQVQGYDFRGLRCAADFVSEAEAMDNCLDQFSDRLEGRRSHVFSVRKDGRRVADVEIGVTDGGCGMPMILQLRGPRNRRASPDVWRAAYAWLGGQELRALASQPASLGSDKARRTARRLWRPYLDAVADPGLQQLLATHIAAELGLTPSAVIGTRVRSRSSAGSGQTRPLATSSSAVARRRVR